MNPRFARQQISQKTEEGFALIAAVIIVAILSVVAIPLMTVVQQNQKSTVQQRVTSHLSHEARENLELGVYLTKLAGGIPTYFTDTLSADAQTLARACDTRLAVADNSLLVADDLTLLDNSSVSAVTTVNNRMGATFIVDKGTSSDSRFERFLVVSCSLLENLAVSVLASELAKVEGSFYTLNLAEY